LNRQEIRDLAAVYRNGMTYAPPRGANERVDFEASTLMGEYRLLLSHFLKACHRLSATHEDGYAIPNESASPVDRQEADEFKRDLEECRDALRADWARRKAERLVGRTLGVNEIRSVVHENVHALFPGEFS
jgi:hypothetical protein